MQMITVTKQQHWRYHDMNFKKIIVLLLIVALMFSLAACGGQQSQQENKNQEAEGEKILRYSYPTSPADFDPINLMNFTPTI